VSARPSRTPGGARVSATRRRGGAGTVTRTTPAASTSFHDPLHAARPAGGARDDAAVQAPLQEAVLDPTLQQNTTAGAGSGTPTVAHDGRPPDITNPNPLSAPPPPH
jgi:hypothetical protein